MVNVALKSQPIPPSPWGENPISNPPLPQIITIQEFIAPKQARLFYQLKQEQFSGQLLLGDNQGNESLFYLYLGRILYATGGSHPVRRWYRHLSVYCPEMVVNSTTIQRDLAAISRENSDLSWEWEYQLLRLWVKQQVITREQLTNIVRSMIVEILFDLTQAGQVSYTLNPDKRFSSPTVVIDADQLIVASWKRWQAWQGARLADRSPNKTPVIKNLEQLQLKTSPMTGKLLAEQLNGENTLRDLASLLKQDLLSLTRSLMLYVQWGLVELIDIADLPSPVSLAKPLPARTTSLKPKLIACIDDSPVLCRLIEKIVTSADLKFISANNGLKAIALCLSQKPDLIFLDSAMPGEDGYDICSQLRQIPFFEQVPIILLTENLGIMDRFRGKIAGCQEMLNKPLDPEQILGVMSKYLEQEAVA